MVLLSLVEWPDILHVHVQFARLDGCSCCCCSSKAVLLHRHALDLIHGASSFKFILDPNGGSILFALFVLRIMQFGPLVQNDLIGNYGRIIFNQNSFGGIQDAIIRGILFHPTSIPHNRSQNALNGLEMQLGVPKSSQCQNARVVLWRLLRGGGNLGTFTSRRRCCFSFR